MRSLVSGVTTGPISEDWSRPGPTLVSSAFCLSFATRASPAPPTATKVSKPWGDCSSYDVGVESNSRVLRVQVKSTTCRTGSGYLCQFKPNYFTEPYKLSQIDFFAAYVIPQDVWYVIPARILISGIRKEAIMLHPMRPLRKNRYRYERFREAWKLLRPRLRKSRKPV